MRSATACASGTTRNVMEQRYGRFLKRYGSVMRYGALQNVERYGTLWKVMQAKRIVTERHGSVTEPLRNVTELYEAVTENIEFAHH